MGMQGNNNFGGVVLNASAAPLVASTKVGNLSFALNNTYQRFVYKNGAQSQFTVYAPPTFETVITYGTNGLPIATNIVASYAPVDPGLLNCDVALKYVALADKINNPRIIAAIGKTLGVVFTPKAQLVLWNYDNSAPAAPYPPGLPAPMASAWNGPRDSDGNLLESLGNYFWPNLDQIDWVNYDWPVEYGDVEPPTDRWPHAYVYISDPKNPNAALGCVEVTPFFSFEEAYCYFCWDVVDRVTTGNLTVTTEPCIGGLCFTKGSGITKFYLTIKFNNIANETENIWLALGQTYDVTADPPLTADPGSYADVLLQAGVFKDTGKGIIDLSADPKSTLQSLKFTVSGVVTYPWVAKTVDGITAPFGIMTMGQGNGFSYTPWCGVLVGSVKIVDTTDARIPAPCVEQHLP